MNFLFGGQSNTDEITVLDLLPLEMCGYWADGLRCFRLFNHNFSPRLDFICSVYGNSSVSSFSIDNNTVRFRIVLSKEAKRINGCTFLTFLSCLEK